MGMFGGMHGGLARPDKHAGYQPTENPKTTQNPPKGKTVVLKPPVEAELINTLHGRIVIQDSDTLRPLEWGDKVTSTKTIGLNKHQGEDLQFCCLNPSIPKYAFVLNEDGNIAEIEAKYLEFVASKDE